MLTEQRKLISVEIILAKLAFKISIDVKSKLALAICFDGKKKKKKWLVQINIGVNLTTLMSGEVNKC